MNILFINIFERTNVEIHQVYDFITLVGRIEPSHYLNSNFYILLKNYFLFKKVFKN